MTNTPLPVWPPKMPGPAWPKLSEDLTGPRDTEHCQSCGVLGAIDDTLHVWSECDDADKPTRVYVVLCYGCSNRIVEPHKRLYVEQPRFIPLPGAMKLCAGCKHLESLACKSPLATFNGGPGLEVIHPKPTVVHLLCSPRWKSGWKKIYKGPPVSCAGREVAG